jgi:multiple antibiotic resistance protein
MATLTEYLRFVVTLTAVVDPFLAIPFFIAFTKDRTAADRARLARVVAITVFWCSPLQSSWVRHYCT